MSQVARYAKVTAKPGKGKELAEILLGAAGDLSDDPGCELYLVSQQADDADRLWVTELWRDQAALDASLEDVQGSDDATRAMALVDDWQLIELDLLGGKGPAAG
jgi:quinol monooxygenase YgiN